MKKYSDCLLNSFVVTATSLLGNTLPASAADDGNATGARSSGSFLEEIIVSARRVEERELTVPITINSFSGEDLGRAQIRTSDDIATHVPGMQVVQDASLENSYAIRGVGPTFLGEPGVVAYFAEVPQSQQGNGPLIDLESVQVLKGPQGTLFGKNSVGGAVLFVPRKPTDDFNGYASVRAGNFDAREVTGAVNIPVSDILAMRVAAQYTERDALTENIAGHDMDSQDRATGRLSILYTPTHSFENYFLLDGYTADEYGKNTGIVEAVDQCNFANPASVACGYLFLSPISLNDALVEQQSLGIDKVAQPSVKPLTLDIWGATNMSTLTLGSITVKNIFGYRDVRRNIGRDLDSFRLTLVQQVQQPTVIKTLTEELQIRGEGFDSKLDWVLGGFYSDDEDSVTDQMTGILEPLAPSPVIIDSTVTAETKAVFGQFTYDLGAMIDGLKFTAGYRYSWDKREFEGASFSAFRSIATCRNRTAQGEFLFGTDPLTCIRTLEQNHEESSWNINLEYAVTDDTFIYATTRRGYKSGNFNTGAAGPSLISFEPETLTDYEIGVKSQGEIAGISYRGSLAGFTGTFKQIQAQEPRFDEGNFGVFVVNVGKASIDGFELQASVAPFEGLEIGAYYGYTDAKYDSGLSLVNYAGKRILNVPKTNAGLNVQFSYPLEEVGILAISGNLNYRGDTPTSYDGPDSAFSGVGSYTVVNAAVGLEQVAGSKVDLRFYVQNLFDDRSAILAQDTRNTLDYAQRRYLDPRMWGLEASIHF